MSVIAHLRIPADSFELGRIMQLEEETQVTLDSMVPLGEKAVPLFSVYGDGRTSFQQRIRDHPSVERLQEVSAHDDQTVYSLDWNVDRDVFFQGILTTEAHLLNATGTHESWEFELRFPDHEALSEFQAYCLSAHITFEVGRIYNPIRPGSGQWYGLTTAQKDTIVSAVEGGYYAIPRQMSTQDLADQFGISDQAVTERLRRAIMELVRNTLIISQQEQDEFETGK